MDPDDRAVDLYKLEYEKAADRYDNIYRSLWTIFSYLTAVAAGFLAFGADRIERHALICLAAIPLLFWFWTTYLPLDRYGNTTLNRLGQIEKLLNSKFGIALDHFSPTADKQLSIAAGIARAVCAPGSYSPTPLEGANQLQACVKLSTWWCEEVRKHLRVFATFRTLWHQLYRARFAICVIFIALHLVVIWEWRAFGKSGQPLFQEKAAAATVGR